jgi:hypothetical protein
VVLPYSVLLVPSLAFFYFTAKAIQLGSNDANIENDFVLGLKHAFEN